MTNPGAPTRVVYHLCTTVRMDLGRGCRLRACSSSATSLVGLLLLGRVAVVSLCEAHARELVAAVDRPHSNRDLAKWGYYAQQNAFHPVAGGRNVLPW